MSGFNLCTQPYQAFIGGPNVAGTGAFSYPVYPGDCTEVRKSDESIIPRDLFFGQIETTLALKAHLSTYCTTHFPGTIHNHQVDDTTKQVGTLSATCLGNPYEGLYLTETNVRSTEGFNNPLDSVGPCTGGAGACTYFPTSAPQLTAINLGLVPDDTSEEVIQETVNDECVAVYN